MSIKKRKIRKYRGVKTGAGSKKKRRGAGNRGGRGKAGIHKHKWTYTVKFEKNYFKRDSLKKVSEKIKVINLSKINEIAIKSNLNEIDLGKCKVLGSGKLEKSIKIKAFSFSKTAIKKIKKVGGIAVSLNKKVDENASTTSP